MKKIADEAISNYINKYSSRYKINRLEEIINECKIAAKNGQYECFAMSQSDFIKFFITEESKTEEDAKALSKNIFKYFVKEFKNLGYGVEEKLIGSSTIFLILSWENSDV